MSKFDELDRLVEEGNGYLQTAQVLKSNISKPTLADYVSKRNMERVAQGVYLARDAWPDELYQLYLSNRRIIFSHETALLLHGLTEREPAFISVTVKAGYNATHLRKRGVHVYQTKADVADLGVVDVKTAFGNMVRAYDRERTICDVIRNKEKLDIQVFQYAMKEFMSGKDKHVHRLMTYARALNIEDHVRTYTEVML